MRTLNFEDYQEKLATQEKYLQLLLWSKKDNKYFLYKPKMASIYGTQNQKKNYYKKLRQKLIIDEDSLKGKISFITLTYDNKLYTPEEVIKRCKKDIQNWLKLIRYRVGKIKYFWICELTKKKYIHFHIIMKQYIPSSIIKACWVKTTGSIITHVKGINAQQAGKYITKYISDSAKMSESQSKFLYDNNFTRLYAHSRGFFGSKLKTKGIYYLIGIVTAKTEILQANQGEFLEIDNIGLHHIINLMLENCWGYIKKF